jgi:hypothetical protein
VSLEKIISIVVAVIVGGVWAVIELRRWAKGKRAKRLEEENGLDPNPTRCADHENRLRKVESVCTEVGPQIKGMEKDIAEIKGDVKTLIGIHLKQ